MVRPYIFGEIDYSDRRKKIMDDLVTSLRTYYGVERKYLESIEYPDDFGTDIRLGIIFNSRCGLEIHDAVELGTEIERTLNDTKIKFELFQLGD